MVCSAYVVGNLSQSGIQFIKKLLELGIIEASFESSVDSFIESHKKEKELLIIFIEDYPENRTYLSKLRKSIPKSSIVFFGRGISKENILLCFENNVELIIDSLRPEDPKLKILLDNLASIVERRKEYETLIRTLKVLFVEGETKDPVWFLKEVKTVIGKLDSLDITSFVGSKNVDKMRIPFYQNQSLAEALSSVSSLERSGKLIIKGALTGQEGEIVFLQGRIASVTTGHVSGLKALYRMFLWDDLKFSFVREYPITILSDDTFNVSIKYISSQGEKQKKIYDELRCSLPPHSIVLEVDPKSITTSVKLNRNAFNTLASVIEFKQVSKILDCNSMNDVDLLASLIKLRKNKMIRVAEAH